MREQAYEAEDGAQDAPGTFARLRGIASTALGAVVAMALLMTLGIWFYRLGVRDAQNVPIIRAAADPVKVRPQDPGGVETPHQNIESYEAASDRPAQAAAVVIAPDPPEPRPEDVPLGELAAAASEPASAGTSDALVTPVPSPVPSGEARSESAEQEVETALLTEPQVPVATTDDAPEAPALEEPEVVTGGTVHAPRRSPVALRRPANLVQRTAAAGQAAEREVGNLAKQAAASAVQIQLAADPNEAAMRSRWERVRKANSDILRGRTLALQTTVSGGKTFYRLRVGPFRDATEARNVCAALKARGQDCIVARNG